MPGILKNKEKGLVFLQSNQFALVEQESKSFSVSFLIRKFK